MRHEEILEAARGIDDATSYGLMLYLCLRARDGKCWPKQATISNDTGFSERRIRRALRKLESLQRIKVTRGKINRYQIIFETGHQRPVVDDHERPVQTGHQRPVSEEQKEEPIVVVGEDEKIERARTLLIKELRCDERNPTTMIRVDQIAKLAVAHRGRLKLREKIGISQTKRSPLGYLSKMLDDETGGELARRIKDTA